MSQPKKKALPNRPPWWLFVIGKANALLSDMSIGNRRLKSCLLLPMWRPLPLILILSRRRRLFSFSWHQLILSLLFLPSFLPSPSLLLPAIQYPIHQSPRQTSKTPQRKPPATARAGAAEEEDTTFEVKERRETSRKYRVFHVSVQQ